uniref:YccS family putative transporter n=1 Tax=Thaumasiovibrio occultus TaxID=1891184 RepID=UPI00131D925B|nr:YccS family putative transporter [Thaumasiovibrio occultus]
MSSSLAISDLNRALRAPRVQQCFMVLLALLGVVLPCWYLNYNGLITPMVLGIIAGALADSDTNVKEKFKALVITLLCFSIAAFSIETLFSRPWLFSLGLGLSTIGFIMLGAMGKRYQPIAFASLLLAVYTMLDAGNSKTLWHLPAALLSGASLYGVIALIQRWCWPNIIVRFQMAKVFAALDQQFASKSELFYPLNNYDVRPLRLKNVRTNTQVVTALNSAKLALQQTLSPWGDLRSPNSRSDQEAERLLSLYFLAQDIHERISASHYLYHDLAKTFAFSDILFRFKRLLEQQAAVCHRIADCMREGESYVHGEESPKALEEVQKSLLHVRLQAQDDQQDAIEQLRFLYDNLAAIEQLLAQVSAPTPCGTIEERTLVEDEPVGLRNRSRLVWQHFSIESPLFRHGVRLAAALLAGYATIQLLNLERGYWILLTTLFVCQQSYSATRQRLRERITGTLLGLLAGLPLLLLVPTMEGQLVFVVISGVMFFYYRQQRYAIATFFITLLVLLCFNQLGQGFAVMLPRLFDTLMGCLLTVLAVNFVLPDWHINRLRPLMATTIAAHRDYLAHIIVQYRHGKKDSLAYRIARRDANRQDAELNTVLTNMLKEPSRHQLDNELCFRFMNLSNAMLSYISTIGAHRAQIDDAATHDWVAKAHRALHGQLSALSDALEGKENDFIQEREQFEKSLETWPQKTDNSDSQDSDVANLILRQLRLIHAILPEMYHLAEQLQPNALQVAKS